MQRHNTEDEPQAQNEDDDRIDFQAGTLIRVQLYSSKEPISHTYPFPNKLPRPTDNTSIGFDLKHILNIVLVLPPAPAARVLLGLALAALSARSAAAFRLMAVRAPPGGVGEDGRAPVAAVTCVLPFGFEGSELACSGEEGRGEDWWS